MSYFILASKKDYIPENQIFYFKLTNIAPKQNNQDFDFRLNAVQGGKCSSPMKFSSCSIAQLALLSATAKHLLQFNLICFPWAAIITSEQGRYLTGAEANISCKYLCKAITFKRI